MGDGTSLSPFSLSSRFEGDNKAQDMSATKATAVATVTLELFEIIFSVCSRSNVISWVCEKERKFWVVCAHHCALYKLVPTFLSLD